LVCRTCKDRADSDVDFLVEFEPGRSLLDQVVLTLELGQLLGHKADVVTEAAFTGSCAGASSRKRHL